MPPPYLGGYGSPGYPPVGGGYPPPGIEQGPPKTSGLAIAALIVGLLVPCLGLFVAVPLGIVALVRISKGLNTGKWLAIGGIVASVLWMIAFVVVAVVLAGQQAERNDAGDITEAGDISYGDIRTGDCVIIPDAGEGVDSQEGDLTGTPCDEAHTVQAVAVFDPGVSDYPGDQQLDQDSGEYCFDEVKPYLRANRELILYRLIPDENTWDSDGGDRVVCFVANEDFSDLTAEITR